jgi:hypothetical protein
MGGTAAYLVTVVPLAHADEASNTIPPSPTFVMPSVDIGEYLTNRTGRIARAEPPSQATDCTLPAAVRLSLPFAKGPIKCPSVAKPTACSRGEDCTEGRESSGDGLTAARSESACRR